MTEFACVRTRSEDCEMRNAECGKPPHLERDAGESRATDAGHVSVRRTVSAFCILHSAFFGAVAFAHPAASPADPSAAELRAVVQHAIQIASPAIVRIDTVGGAQPVADEGQQQVPGFRQADGPTTGVIWSNDGWIVTSSFNFLRDPSIITATLSDGRRLVAKLVARDLPNRLALLKVDAVDLPKPGFGTVGDTRVGQRVLVAGFGFSSTTPAVSLGVISARERMNGVALQTDAKTSPANYGGPLFDLDGRVLGVIVPLGASEDEAAGVDWYDSGIGFAVPLSNILSVVDRWVEEVDL